MPIPTSIDDLSTIPGNNFPDGTDTPDVIDNVLREHAAYIAQLRDDFASDSVRTDLATTGAGKGAELVAFKQSGTGSKARNTSEKLKESGVFAADFEGYDATGATDSTAAIQAAINASAADGSYTVYITGKPAITGQLTYTGLLSLVGVCGDNVFTNSFDLFPVRIQCNALTGYVFDQPDVTNGSGGLSISKICFDGRAGGVNSSTWQGLVKAATTVGKASFYLRLDSVLVGNSDSATPILDLGGEVFSHCYNSGFFNWGYGYGVKTGGAGILATTMSFEKCYWNSLRQVYEFAGSNSDITFSRSVMESVVVCGAAINTTVNFNDCYSENIGYDCTGTGITTGLTARSFDIADAPAIAGNVTAAHTCRYGQMIFKNYTIQNTVGGKKWFDGIGRASGIGNGGLIDLQNLRLAAGSPSNLFALDADAPSSRHNFEYKATVTLGSSYLTHADARMITKGRVPISWSDGIVRPVEVENGLFTIPKLSVNGLTAMPTIYPTGGANAIGDVANMSVSNLAKGKRSAYRCSVAGSTGSKWDICEFTPSSMQANVVAGGTMALQATSSDNPGEVHVWEVLASTGANIESLYRVTMQAFSGAGVLFSDGVVVSKTLTFAMTWAGVYTITVTNTSASTLNIYARLVSVTNAHT